MNLSYEEYEKAMEHIKSEERKSIITQLSCLIGGDEAVERHKVINDTIKGVIKIIQARGSV